MTYLYVFLGGGLGSLARFLVGRMSTRMFSTNFPIGTLIANLAACALLALMVLSMQSASKADWYKPMLIIGFCGGFSTFSTFGNETFELIDSGNWTYAVLNVVISILVGVGLIFLIRSRA